MITHQKNLTYCRNSQRKHEIHHMSSIFNDTNRFVTNHAFYARHNSGFFGTWDSQSYLTTGEASKNIWIWCGKYNGIMFFVWTYEKVVKPHISWATENIADLQIWNVENVELVQGSIHVLWNSIAIFQESFWVDVIYQTTRMIQWLLSLSSKARLHCTLGSFQYLRFNC